MADVMKFGQERERRPNPLVELHPGFEGKDGTQVEAYVTLTKFKRDASGKWTVSKFNTSVSNIPTLIRDLEAAEEAARDEKFTEETTS